jgi:hypothetical protein
MILPSSDAVTTYRAIFLSDLHLGAKSSRTADILDFLRRHEAEHIYLVGDIIDGWQLRKNWNWSQATNDVIQKLSTEISNAVLKTDFRDRLLSLGTTPVGSDPARLAEHVQAELARWSAVVKSAGIKP